MVRAHRKKEILLTSWIRRDRVRNHEVRHPPETVTDSALRKTILTKTEPRHRYSYDETKEFYWKVTRSFEVTTFPFPTLPTTIIGDTKCCTAIQKVNWVCCCVGQFSLLNRLPIWAIRKGKWLCNECLWSLTSKLEQRLAYCRDHPH